MLQEFTQEIKNRMLDAIRDVHTVIQGRIVTFDPDNCEASILPFGKFKMPDGSVMDYPHLTAVPVYTIQGSGQTATIAYPIKHNDECTILFSEQSLDTWRTKAKSDTDLRFDLSNAIAIVGLFDKPNPLVREACDDDAIIIEKDGTRVKLTMDEITICDKSGQVITLSQSGVTISASNVNITASGGVFIAGDLSVEGNISNAGNMVTGGIHTDSIGTHVTQGDD